MKWRWVGHVTKQNNQKWTIRVVQWCPKERRRCRGRPQKPSKDDIKEVYGKNWFQIAQIRLEWKRRRCLCPEVDIRSLRKKKGEGIYKFNGYID